MEGLYKTFTHNPPHLFVAGASYMITAATYQKLPYLLPDDRKAQLLDAIQYALSHGGWELVACAILHNHYHAVIRAPQSGADGLSPMVASVHKFTARRWNQADRTSGRSVWWNYWDTCLTNEASYYARVNYVHWNPVKHRLTERAELYAFSTYRVWLQQFPAELRHIEHEYPFDRVKVYDEF